MPENQNSSEEFTYVRLNSKGGGSTIIRVLHDKGEIIHGYNLQSQNEEVRTYKTKNLCPKWSELPQPEKDKEIQKALRKRVSNK